MTCASTYRVVNLGPSPRVGEHECIAYEIVADAIEERGARFWVSCIAPRRFYRLKPCQLHGRAGVRSIAEVSRLNPGLLAA
jgi:hypothetical protein